MCFKYYDWNFLISKVEKRFTLFICFIRSFESRKTVSNS